MSVACKTAPPIWKASAAPVELTVHEKRENIAREIGRLDFLGDEVTSHVPQPPTTISDSLWIKHCAQFRFFVMDDGRVFRDHTPDDLYKRWWEAEVRLGYRKEHEGASFSPPEMFVVYDYNTLAPSRVKYLACYWKGPEGIKVVVTDRFSNNIEYMNMNVAQAVKVMDMLQTMVA